MWLPSSAQQHDDPLVRRAKVVPAAMRHGCIINFHYLARTAPANCWNQNMLNPCPVPFWTTCHHHPSCGTNRFKCRPLSMANVTTYTIPQIGCTGVQTQFFFSLTFRTMLSFLPDYNAL